MVLKRNLLSLKAISDETCHGLNVLHCIASVEQGSICSIYSFLKAIQLLWPLPTNVYYDILPPSKFAFLISLSIVINPGRETCWIRRPSPQTIPHPSSYSGR